MNRTLCADIGQVQDPSFLSIVEQKGRFYECGWMEQHFDMPYPAQIKYLAMLMGKPAMRDADLVIDATGVGRPIADGLRDLGVPVVAVIITAGATEHNDGRFWWVPKVDLVKAGQIILQENRLRLPQNHPLSDVVRSQFRDFRVKVTGSKNEKFAAKEGKHDDGVISLCLGFWNCRRHEEPPAEPAGPKRGSHEWIEAERLRLRDRAIQQAESEGKPDGEFYPDSGLDMN